MEVVLSSEAETQVSVGIGSLAGTPFIDECLSSLEDQVRRCGAETVVVACGTSDYAQRIAQKFPRIRMIHRVGAVGGPVSHDRYRRLIGYLPGCSHLSGETAEALVRSRGETS